MTFDEAGWRARLEAHFTEFGLVGGRLVPIIQAENSHAQHSTRRFGNFNYISDACLGFLCGSLAQAEALRIRRVSSGPENYGAVLLSFSTVFRQLRAARIVALSGYPTQGFGLLRDVKDQALQFAAWLHGLTHHELSSGNVAVRDGLPGESLAERIAFNRRLHKHRAEEQKRIARRLMGADSGLSASDQQSLLFWSGIFHHEVHGARLMSASGLVSDWFRGRALLPILAQPDDLTTNLFLTNFTKVAWMV